MRTKLLALVLMAASGCSQGPGPAAPGAVGSACTADRDCASGLTCFTATPGGVVWAGGYCTRPCSSETCPAGSTCTSFYSDAATLSVVTYCASSCVRAPGSRDVCREGYACSYDGVCISGCRTNADCAMASPAATCETASGRCLVQASSGAASGAACMNDADCRGPQAFCNNGHCMRISCDLGGAYACDAGQICSGFPIEYDHDASFCTMECTPGVDAVSLAAPGRCPTGWTCFPARADLRHQASSGFCFPSDYADPFHGSSTARVGDPCTTFMDCPNPFGYGVCTHAMGTTMSHCSIVYCAAPTVASMNICGPGSVCLTFPEDPSRDRFTNAGSVLGGCFRQCDAMGHCPSGLACAGVNNTCTPAP